MQCTCSINELRRLSGGIDASPVADWLERMIERRLLLALRTAGRQGDARQVPETDWRSSDISLPSG